MAESARPGKASNGVCITEDGINSSPWTGERELLCCRYTFSTGALLYNSSLFAARCWAYDPYGSVEPKTPSITGEQNEHHSSLEIVGELGDPYDAPGSAHQRPL